MTPEQSREEGRREGRSAEQARITAIMEFSISWNGCSCPRCNGVAQDLAFETNWPASVCQEIIRRCVHGTEALQ